MRFHVVFLALFLSLSAAYAEEYDFPHGDFYEDCTICHLDIEKWSPVTFPPDWKHPDKFPLRGTHRAVPCLNCHITLDFTKAPPYCAGCHTDAHRGEMGTDCSLCHTPTNFLDRSAQRDRHRMTRFPLFGAHAVQDCASCHIPRPQGNLTWVGTPVECFACHEKDYRAATEPNHVLALFPTDCQLCHTPTVWERARFVHAGGRFPLTGAHQGLPCSRCHANGFVGTPSDCYSCHSANYLATTNPNHVQLGFPTDCTLCHNTTSFAGAIFTQHDTLYFPIYSGRHNGRWTQCTDCHTQPSNFAVFSCFLCHSSPDTTPRHSGVSGYAYDSNLCYQCHPQGRAGG